MNRAAMRALGMALMLAAPLAAQSHDALVLRGVNVVDVARGQVTEDQTVVIRGSRIVAIDARSKIAIPSGASIVEAGGKFLIPGLWDMHAHIWSHSDRPGTDDHAWHFPLYVANGVTGVRDMWTNLEDFRAVRAWNDSAAAGQLIAPLVFGTGPMVDGPDALLRHVVVVASPNDAARVVDSLANGGAHSIKIHSALSRDAFLALAARAAERHVPLIGHVPAAVTIREAIAAGQSDVEHYAASDGCASEAAESEVLRLRADRSQRQPAGRLQQLILDGYDERRCMALLSELAQRGVWVTPTLVAAQFRLVPTDLTIDSRDELRYVPAPFVTDWKSLRAQTLARTSASLAETRGRVFDAQVRLVGAMQHAGVRLLVGTDVSNEWLVPGFSVHDELALFVAGGVTPAQALRAATLSAAQYLGVSDSLGTVAVGAVANLVLLDGNPLQNIRNTRAVRSVVMRGRYLDRRALDALLKKVESEGR